jgi:hypothetical protein
LNRPGLIRCFSPDHEDKNPSCQISEDGFFCHACGIHGDIYDAIGILEGITDKTEQYLFAEKIFDGGPSGVKLRQAPKKPVQEKRAKDYSRDTAADGLLEAYMRRNPAAEKIIKEFFKVRAAASTAGAVRDYPADIIPELMRYFFYWPG